MKLFHILLFVVCINFMLGIMGDMSIPTGDINMDRTLTANANLSNTTSAFYLQQNDSATDLTEEGWGSSLVKSAGMVGKINQILFGLPNLVGQMLPNNVVTDKIVTALKILLIFAMGVLAVSLVLRSRINEL